MCLNVSEPQIAINNTVTMIVVNHNILIHVECTLIRKAFDGHDWMDKVTFYL